MQERYEWIHSWSDEADKVDLPRVLLIGDSITYSYQERVRELLKGRYYVDYVATSYAIDREIYNSLIKNFVLDNRYAVIHFNHGLHGKHMARTTYQKCVERLLNEIIGSCKIILALTTKVNEEGNERIDESWAEKIAERNEVLLDLAKKYGYEIDDLYSLSIEIPVELRKDDGTHYHPDSAEIFAQKVVESIINKR